MENETFNTLKNQGYHLEHNYGHGKEHLSFNFLLLNLRAFFVHQIFELTYIPSQQLRQKFGSKRNLWDHLRACLIIVIAPDLDTYFRGLLTPSRFLLRAFGVLCPFLPTIPATKGRRLPFAILSTPA